MRLAVTLLMIGAAFAWGQARETFDIASIKPADTTERGTMIQFAPGGRLVARNVTLRILITAAFEIRDFQIVGAPGWAGTDRYTIEAESSEPDDFDPRKMTNEQIRTRAQRFEAKMRGLLEDRFALKARGENREMPVYNLAIAKNGPKLSAAVAQKKDGSPRRPGFSIGRGLLEGDNASMQLLTRGLAEETGRTVIDRTGLQGNYDYKVEWTPQAGEMPAAPAGPAPAPPADATGPSLFTAIQEQLGLKLEPAKGPVEVLVIDHVEKPSPN